MQSRRYIAALAFLLMLFALLVGACENPISEAIFWCDEHNNCADLPGTVCNDRDACVCAKADEYFCFRLNVCATEDVCFPPPPCDPSDAGDPDSD